MINSGINKSAFMDQLSFGDWAVKREYSRSEAPTGDRPAYDNQTRREDRPGTENKKIASRRAAAYWESRK